MGLLRLFRPQKHVLGLLVVPFLALALAGPAVLKPRPSRKIPRPSARPTRRLNRRRLPPSSIWIPASRSPPRVRARRPLPLKPRPSRHTTTAQPAPEQIKPKAEPEPADAAAHAAASADIQPGSKILVNIDKSTQEMTVFVDGMERYSWKVSTGRGQYDTPTGTFTPTSMNEIWYSKQWDNSPMPHAIFFMKDGHAIHGTHEVKNLGKPASHGCVRLAPENAATLYAMVEKTGMENTQVVLSGEAPGAEPKVASPGPNYQYQYQYPYQRRGQPVPPWFNPGAQAEVQQDYQQQQRRGDAGCSGGAGSSRIRAPMPPRPHHATTSAATAIDRMNETALDPAAMGRLAKALVFICGAEHPTTVALKAAAASGSERDIKNARTLSGVHLRRGASHDSRP